MAATPDIALGIYIMDRYASSASSSGRETTRDVRREGDDQRSDQGDGGTKFELRKLSISLRSTLLKLSRPSIHEVEQFEDDLSSASSVSSIGGLRANGTTSVVYEVDYNRNKGCVESWKRKDESV